MEIERSNALRQRDVKDSGKNRAQIQTQQATGQENKRHLNNRATEQIFIENE